MIPEQSSDLEDPIEVAARFVLTEPGWTTRVLSAHAPDERGACAGCEGYHAVPWPCVLVHIARRAETLRTMPGR